jgi:hypothetical protein
MASCALTPGATAFARLCQQRPLWFLAHAGQIDLDELAAVVETLATKQSTIRHLRLLIAILVCGGLV